MTETADAVVIGGGIVGASALFHLGSLGLGQTVLCERRQLGAGASGASGAFVQFHFCQDETETRLTQASLPYFQAWDEIVGAGSSGFISCGYLRLEPAERETVTRERVAMLQRLGVETEIVTLDDVARMAPYLNLEGVSIAVYEPASGYADANRCVEGLIGAARKLGGRVLPGNAVTGVRVEGGHVSGVETTDGPIDTPLVIAAAGAWSAALLGMVGLDLPLTRAWTQWIGFAVESIPDGMMTVGDGVSPCYFRPDGDRILIGLGGSSRFPLDDLEAPEPVIAPDVVALGRERLAGRLRTAGSLRHVAGRTGPIAVTPDNLPIIDRHPELDGLYFFAGDCGSSFKTGPAIGRALAEWAVLGQPEVADVSALSLGRFGTIEHS